MPGAGSVAVAVADGHGGEQLERLEQAVGERRRRQRRQRHATADQVGAGQRRAGQRHRPTSHLAVSKKMFSFSFFLCSFLYISELTTLAVEGRVSSGVAGVGFSAS